MGGELVEYLVNNEEGFRKARLPALYSDFRGLRATNPDGYAANVSAWRRALASIARSGLAPPPSSSSSSSSSSPSSSAAAATPNLLVLEAGEPLLRALESRQFGRPLALGAVVREAALERDLIPLQDFLRARESIYYRSWASLPWDVVGWGLRQVGLAGGGASDRLPGGLFVVVANVEAASAAFAKMVAAEAGSGSAFERAWSAAHFKKKFAGAILPGQRLSDTDMEVLLKFMSRDKGIVVYDGRTVKIKAPGDRGEETSTSAGVITAEDEAMSQVKELTEYLSHQTAVLSRRVDELAAAARDAVLRKNRVAALAALRSKKLAESSLEKRFATLSQLEAVAAKLEQAADQVQLVRVMAAGADALRSLNAQVGGAETVEGVVDRLREQMAAVDEVGSILAEAGPAIDESEVDDELAALERDEREKEEKERRAKEEADRARREAEAEKQAEETRRRLAAIETPPVTTAAQAETQPRETQEDEEADGAEELAGEVAKSIGELSLDDKPAQKTQAPAEGAAEAKAEKAELVAAS